MLAHLIQSIKVFFSKWSCYIDTSDILPTSQVV